MREHKYRAWDKENKIMIYNIEDKPAPLGDTLNEWINDKRFEVTEYTELKDKNKKDIYEGDIVRNCIEYTGFMDGVDLGIIEYKGAEFVIITKNHHQIVEDWIKIIGNIYENPGLINGERR